MRNQPKNREIKTQIHEKSIKEQRNQNQLKPMRINPSSVQIKTIHTHEKSTQRTHRKIITHKTNHNPKLQKDRKTYGEEEQERKKERLTERKNKKERKKEEEEYEAEEEKEDKEKRQRVERLTERAEQGREKR